MLFESLQVLNKVKEVGVENIIDVIVIEYPQNTWIKHGFAFVKLESYKDAQIAFKIALQKSNAFGRERPIKVAWAQPLNDMDEDVIAQVWLDEYLLHCFLNIVL